MDPNKSEYVIERRPPITNLSNLSNQDSMFKYNRPAANNTPIIKSNRRPTYAQWITKAIAESPSKAITLADINEWMIRNVPGLQEQRYLHSCKGWKNAVRHTLSINRHRFKKVTRDGKPSLWCLINTETISSNVNDESIITDNVLNSNLNHVETNFKEKPPISSSTKLSIETAGHHESNEQQQNDHIRQTNSLNSIVNMTENFGQSAKNPPKTANDSVTALMSTQTLEIMYADGILGKIVLPMPLPISSLNFGGFLLNSATNKFVVGNGGASTPQQPQLPQQPPVNNWNVNSNVSNMAIARQMSSSLNNNTNNMNLMWDLFNLCDLMKYKNFI